jgi:hypothetical protein
MARRRSSPADAAVAPSRYAEYGPRVSDCIVWAGDPRERSSEIKRQLEEWAAWHREWYVKWRNGDAAPPPPNAHIFAAPDA